MNYRSTTVMSPRIEDGEIDLSQVVSALLRQKLPIAAITFSAAVLSCIYAFTRKPIWEGSFQIVLEEQQDSSLSQLASTNSILSNFGGFSSSGVRSSLETEVKILESPSVLKPVYDFVKSMKVNDGQDVSRWKFTNWANSLSVELIKGTSVLNLTYQDSDKKLILPVLNLISDTYQDYSKKDSNQSIDNGLRFAKEQSIILQIKAKESNRKLDEFKFTYGIAGSDTQVNPAALEKLTSPLSQSAQGLDPLSELAAINKELTRRLQFFTKEDPSIKRLQKERQATLKYIDQSGGGLISIANGGSKEKNREILLQYKDLLRTALRDNAALTSMESELLNFQIQKSQKRQPWELISTPTILDSSVAPSKKRIIVLGTFAGFVFGLFVGLFRDRLSDLVFSDSELGTSLTGPLLERLSLLKTKNWPIACELLAQGPLKQAQSIALIPVGQPDSRGLQELTSALQSALCGRSLLVSNNLVKTRSCELQVLLVQPGKCSRSQLRQLQQSLALQGTPVAGWLLLEPRGEAV